MTIQKHIGFELAKRIHDIAKEKGVELPIGEKHWNVHELKTEGQFIETYAGNEYRGPEAYDCAELGDILKRRPDFIVVPHFDTWSSENERGGYFDFCPLKDSEVEARGELLYYLISNDLYNGNNKSNRRTHRVQQVETGGGAL